MRPVSAGVPSAWTVADRDADTSWIVSLDDAARRDLTGAVRMARDPGKRCSTIGAPASAAPGRRPRDALAGHHTATNSRSHR